MKKKAIEKIPYLTLPAVSQEKETEYVGVTAVKVIDHEKHLFLEVYQNDENSRNVPLVRIVLTKKDFGSYFPEEEKWTRQKIQTDGGWGRLIWKAEGGWQEKIRKNVLSSPDDLNRLKAFCKVTVWNENRWWEYIMKHQNDIVITARRKTEKRKYERRQEALDERIRNTRALPEQKILKRANDVYFQNEHYLYYKRRGNWVQIACSKCGGVTDVRWKAGESYESHFQRHVEVPQEGRTGICPLCGTSGTYKCQGKAKSSHSKRIHLFLGQKYKEKGLVMRYLELEKEWQLELVAGDHGDEMHGAYEEMSGVEIARAYFEPGKKVQIDYQKHDWYSGKDFWDDCNLYGNTNITIEAAPILPETYDEIKGTEFQYSALKEYAAVIGKVNPIEYFKRYEQTPQIEMLVKLGLFGVANELVNCRYGIVSNENARQPDIFLGIRKGRVKQLISRKGNIRFLKTMQAEKRMGQIWTEEQIEKITEAQLSYGQLETATKYMSLQKLLNRIERYSGCRFGTACSSAEQVIRNTANTYMDYIGMRLALGYDMNNTVYQQPRDLRAAHDKMVQESNKEKMDERIREVEQKYSDIRLNYRKLRNIYFYEDDTYMIRPARSAKEIVEEGRLLHHCVGGDSYLNKHNDGRSYILMLRFKDKEEEPYITVEISSGKAHIMQWYGARDRKPDEKNMQKWLDQYLEQLRNKQKQLARTA